MLTRDPESRGSGSSQAKYLAVPRENTCEGDALEEPSDLDSPVHNLHIRNSVWNVDRLRILREVALEVVTRIGGRSSRTCSIAIGIAALIAATAAVTSSRSSRIVAYHHNARLQAKVETLPGLCGVVENDVNYVVEGNGSSWGYGLDHIPSPDMCCALCQGVPKCKAWVWVKDALLVGCPSQCWLKGGLPTKRHRGHGFVSGLPPPRPSLVASRALISVRPVKPPPSPGSIFCFSLMQVRTYEVDLLKFQHSVNASIFACDAWAVYSNMTMSLVAGVNTTVVPTDLSVQYGGTYNTALNSWIFIAVWHKVIHEKRHEKHDWLVKVDPDAVFFPERLRNILVDHKGVGYISNCRFGMHGPIEVLSNRAVEVLASDYQHSPSGDKPDTCVKGLDADSWGEDYFLDNCLKSIHGVSRSLDGRLMCEDHCDCPEWYWCKKGTAWATFHPFKRVDWYRQCMANAMDGANMLSESTEASGADPKRTPDTSPSVRSDFLEPAGEEGAKREPPRSGEKTSSWGMDLLFG